MSSVGFLISKWPPNLAFFDQYLFWKHTESHFNDCYYLCLSKITRKIIWLIIENQRWPPNKNWMPYVSKMVRYATNYAYYLPIFLMVFTTYFCDNLLRQQITWFAHFSQIKDDLKIENGHHFILKWHVAKNNCYWSNVWFLKYELETDYSSAQKNLGPTSFNYCISYQKLACFVLYLKIINTLENSICIL